MKKIFFVLFYLALIIPLSAQDVQVPSVAPASPNASALALYADIPVSHYTGVPNINIPIYEINTGDYSLPITLSYHASGIKVNQEASWVGLGWSLNVGGVITRSVRGGDDFDPQQPHYHVKLDTYDDYDLLEDLFYGKRDMEPDIFYFNFGSYSGKFILGENNTAILFEPDKNIKIDLKYDNGKRYWEVYDGNGICYIFKDIERTKSYSFYEQSSVPTSVVYPSTWDLRESRVESSWYLSEIRLLNKESIFFKYQSKGDGGSWFPLNKEQRKRQLISLCASGKFGNPVSIPLVGSEFIYSTSMIEKELFLEEITWSGGRILFQTSDRLDLNSNGRKPQKLDWIYVYNTISPSALYSFEFETDYFNSQYLNSSGDNKYLYPRLKLSGLKARSTVNPEVYSFAYDESSLLPAKNSVEYDHWGYFNNNSPANKTLTPKYRYSYVEMPPIVGCSTEWHDDFLMHAWIDGADRESNFKRMLLGTLNKITYPTGGACNFFYEMHDYISDDYMYQNEMIYALAESQEEVVKEFEITEPTIARIYSTVYNYNIDCDNTPPSRLPIGEVYGSIALLPVTSNSFRSPLAFPEDYCDDNHIEGYNDYTVNLYPGKYRLTLKPYPGYGANCSVTFERSSAGKEEIRKSGAGIRISKIQTDATTRHFNYTMDDGRSSGKLLVQPKYAYINDCQGILDDGSTYAYYALESRSESLLPLSDFKSGINVGYTQVKEFMVTGKDSSITEYKFMNSVEIEQLDYRILLPNIPSLSNGLPIEINYYKNNRKKVKQEKFHYYRQEMAETRAIRYEPKGYLGGGLLLLGAKFDYAFYSLFSEWWVLHNKTDIIFSEDSDENVEINTSYSYNDVNYLPSKVEVTNSNNEVTFTRYSYPTDYMTVSPYKEMVSSHILSPVIETVITTDGRSSSCERVDYQILGNGSFKPKFISYGTGPSTLEPRLEYKKYDKYGNAVYIVKDGSDDMVYLWAYGGQYPVAEIRGMSYEDVCKAINGGEYTIERFDTDLTMAHKESNVLRDNSRGSMITTYTYDPLVGVTSMTDPSGITTTYVYDSFGRLQSVKDHHGNIMKHYKYNYRQ